MKEQAVTTQAGVWIDHRKAVLVSLSGKTDTTTVFESGAEKDAGDAAGPGSRGSQGAEDTRERHFEGQLARFYDEVIAGMREAESIFIFGPGEAKGELKKRLEHEGLGARIVGVETTDKLTDPQIAAKVREHFAA